MGSATLTSGRTCTPTLSCPEAPPCTLVLLTACRRRSPPLPPPPSRSRSSLPPRGSTPSGSEAPSWLPSPHYSRCGSPSRSTTSAAPPSSTASASKRKSLCFALLSNPLQNFKIYIFNSAINNEASILKSLSNNLKKFVLKNLGLQKLWSSLWLHRVWSPNFFKYAQHAQQ